MVNILVAMFCLAVLAFGGVLAMKDLDELLELPVTPMGSQAGADPEDHPRWDGERIRTYDWAEDECELDGAA